MRIITGTTLAIAITAGGLALSADTVKAAGGMAHAHMGHVMTNWTDTPDNMGFLPTAIAEAEIANKHAGLAAKKPDDLKWMQTHARHILHAIDASLEAKGPGLGYGVLKASASAGKHIGIGAKAADASGNVKAHAVHVMASADNTVARANEIVVHGNKVLAATSASDAATHVDKIVALSGQLMAGVDANGDGKITWQKGEGGLDAMKKHMGLMAKGEGMN